MSELVSEQVFDQFRGSDWPQQFSRMAQAARTEGVEGSVLDKLVT